MNKERELKPVTAAAGAQGVVSHDPEAIAAELADKLAARSRHIALVLGAGASMAVGLPGLEQLGEEALAAMAGQDLERAKAMMDGRNLEQALTRLRRLASVLEGDQELDGLDRNGATETERALSRAVVAAILAYDPDTGPYRDIASWAAGGYYSRPVEVFSLNYDLLFERALEEVAVPYFDGFVGNLRAEFRPDLVEASPGVAGLPVEFLRLWKLHGSINWTRTDPAPQRIVRLGVPAGGDGIAVIYPSEVKYEESRRVPFVVLFDRFRKSLAEVESLVVTVGYSFRDEHINELLYDACPRNKRSEYVALFQGDIPADLKTAATRSPNLTVLGAHEAVIGGQQGVWTAKDEIPDVWTGGDFRLGDFHYLARFLARTVRPPDPLEAGLNA